MGPRIRQRGYQCQYTLSAKQLERLACTGRMWLPLRIQSAKASRVVDPLEYRRQLPSGCRRSTAQGCVPTAWHRLEGEAEVVWVRAGFGCVNPSINNILPWEVTGTMPATWHTLCAICLNSTMTASRHCCASVRRQATLCGRCANVQASARMECLAAALGIGSR